MRFNEKKLNSNGKDLLLKQKNCIVMKTSMLRKLIISTLLLLLVRVISAQESSMTGIKNTVLEGNDKSESLFSLFAGAAYGVNMIYMGSDFSQNKPYYTGSLIIGFKDEVYLSLTGNYLSAFNKFNAFSTYSLSYNHAFNSWLDISLSTSAYHVNSELSDTLFNNFLYSNVDVGFDWKILYTSFSVGGVFSESNSAYFQLRNSKYLKTKNFFNGKAYLSFDPYVNLIFGTLTKTFTTDGITVGVTSPFKSAKSSGGQRSSASVYEYFGLMDLDFGLPVGFNIGKFSIETEPGYVIPAYSDTSIQSPEGFTFLINLYYQFF